jgi:hypothetical protein
MTFGSHIQHAFQAAYLSHRGLPNAPDGVYEPAQEDPGLFVNVATRIREQMQSGITLPQNPRALDAFLQALHGTVTRAGIDDRLHAIEDGLDILSEQPQDSTFVKAVNGLAITARKQIL